MENPTNLKSLAAQVQKAVDAYVAEDNVVNYKDLQTVVQRLQVAASTPADTLFTFRLQVIGNIAIAMSNELGILDALVAKPEKMATARELAGTTGCSEEVIERLMRLASGLGFCEELDVRTYGVNDITECLVQPGWKGALEWMEIIYPVASRVRDYLSSTQFGRAKKDITNDQTAFEFVHGKSMWTVLEDMPGQRRNFDLWMRERRKHEETSWHKRFPPSASLDPASLRNDPGAVLMVDVGGANGSQLINFKEQFPNLPGRCVLQDLPESVASVKAPAGVEVMAYDFFTPQPIKGARFYYFRNVFHNWPDDKCAEILRNVVPAMDPEYSSLLIDDYVLPSKGAQLRSAIADVHMMMMFNSSERTSEQYEKMLHEAGLDVVAVFPVGVNEEAIMEIKVAKSQ